MVTVRGGGLGGADYSVGMRAGVSGSEGSWWASDSAVMCGAASGAGGSARAVATAGAQAGLSLTEAMSYDSGQAWAKGGACNGQQAGSTETGRLVWVVVSAGGSRASSLRSGAGRLGGTGCERTEWAGNSGVVCYAGLGGGRSLAVSATAGVVVSTRTEAWSMAAAALSVVSETNGGRAGVAGLRGAVTVAGQGLGGRDGSVRGRVGGSACEVSRWGSDTSVRCLPGRGGGGSRGVSVSARAGQGSLSAVMSLESGGAMQVQGGASNGLGRGGGAWGVAVVWRAAEDGGVWSMRGRVGGSGLEASVWSGDTWVACRAAAGRGGSLGAALTGGLGMGTVSEALTYDGGSVSSFGAANGAGGWSRQVVSGVWGGGLGAGVSPRGRWGASGGEGSEWVSDTSLRGRRTKGVGESRVGAVTAGGGAGSVSMGLSYDAWQGSSVSRSNGAGAAGRWDAAVGVSGGGLGLQAGSVAGRAGHTGAEATAWWADSSVVCLTGRGGGGGSRRLGVTVGEATGSVSEAATYGIGGGLSSAGAANVGRGEAGRGELGVRLWLAGGGGGGWSGGGSGRSQRVREQRVGVVDWGGMSQCSGGQRRERVGRGDDGGVGRDVDGAGVG